MPAILPILLFIPLTVISLASIVVTSLKNIPAASPLPSSVASPSSTPTPVPSPTPSPSPTPTPTPVSSPTPTQVPQAQSSLSSTSLAGATVLTYDLASITVVTDTANDNDCANDCPAKPLAQHIADNGGRAGMNGTYFCPPDYASCAGKVSSFDFPVFNNRLKKWINADKLFWGGRGMFTFRPGSATFYANAASGDASTDLSGGIVNYPSLIAGGNVVLNEGSIPDNLKTKGSRSGIGTGGGKLFLVVARSASMSDLVVIFQQLGATDALNLDGGGSVALYDGGYKVGPGRSLPNAVIIK